MKTLPGVTKTRVSFYISFDPEAHGKIAIEFELSEQNIAALKTIGGEVFFTVDRSSPEEP